MNLWLKPTWFYDDSWISYNRICDACQNTCTGKVTIVFEQFWRWNRRKRILSDFTPKYVCVTINFLCWRSSYTIIRHVFTPAVSKRSSGHGFFENTDHTRVEVVTSRYNDYMNGSQYKICKPVDGDTIHYKLRVRAQTMAVRTPHPHLAPFSTELTGR
jgi:hypothetical protein